MANEKSFGKRVVPGYHFENANVIVSFVLISSAVDFAN
jgi:hypothetical protein